MSLITRCPKCQSGFAVTPDQLKQHDGLVRCGQCRHVFDGYDGLQGSVPTLTQQIGSAQASSEEPITESPLEHIPEAPPETPIIPPIESLPTHTDAVGTIGAAYATDSETSESSDIQIFSAIRPDNLSASATAIYAEDEPYLGSSSFEEPLNDEFQDSDEPFQVMGESRTRGDDPSAVGWQEPEFLDDEESMSLGAWFLWTGLSVLLVFVLVFQLLVYFRNDLVTAYPQTRPLLVWVCKPIDCEVNYVRRIDRIVIIGSSLQQSPEKQANDQLNMALKLTMQNRSTDPQPWPHLLLSLSDASGTVVAKKVIPPSEYLPQSQPAQPFLAREEVVLNLDLDVTGLSVSGFEVEKFFP